MTALRTFFGLAVFATLPALPGHSAPANWSKANTHWVDMAASTDHAKALAYIKDGHIQPNIADEDGNTPLMMAAREGDLPAAQELIARGADIHAHTNYHYAPLRCAIAGRNPEIVALLLAHGADANADFVDGVTPLMEASSFGSLPMVNLLLAHGAKVEARTKTGGNALNNAAGNNHPDVIAALIDHGADPNQFGDEDETPLMRASLSGKLAAVKMLVRKGAKLDIQNNSYKTTALLAASGMPPNHTADYVGVVTFLLQAGANPHLADKNDLLPLMAAATYDRADIIRVLARHGADLKSANGDGAKAFADSIQQKHRLALKALLDAGINPNLQVGNNCPALIYATEMNDLPTVRMLIDAKANVNITRRQDIINSGPGGGREFITSSALIVAVDAGSAQIAEVLLKAGAKRMYKDNLGHTALDHARLRKNLAIVKLLEAAGSK